MSIFHCCVTHHILRGTPGHRRRGWRGILPSSRPGDRSCVPPCAQEWTEPRSAGGQTLSSPCGREGWEQRENINHHREAVCFIICVDTVAFYTHLKYGSQTMHQSMHLIRFPSRGSGVGAGGCILHLGWKIRRNTSCKKVSGLHRFPADPETRQQWLCVAPTRLWSPANGHFSLECFSNFTKVNTVPVKCSCWKAPRCPPFAVLVPTAGPTPQERPAYWGELVIATGNASDTTKDLSFRGIWLSSDHITRVESVGEEPH